MVPFLQEIYPSLAGFLLAALLFAQRTNSIVLLAVSSTGYFLLLGAP